MNTQAYKDFPITQDAQDWLNNMQSSQADLHRAAQVAASIAAFYEDEAHS